MDENEARRLAREIGDAPGFEEATVRSRGHGFYQVEALTVDGGEHTIRSRGEWEDVRALRGYDEEEGEDG